MVPWKQSTTMRIWEPVARCSATLPQSLVTVKEITFSSGWEMVFTSIHLSGSWLLQNSSQRLATDWPPGLDPKRDNCSPLLGKPVKKYTLSDSISSRLPPIMKHWSRMLHLFTSHCKKSTCALMPVMVQNLKNPHALNACNERGWSNAAWSTSSFSLSCQTSILCTYIAK